MGGRGTKESQAHEVLRSDRLLAVTNVLLLWLMCAHALSE